MDFLASSTTTVLEKAIQGLHMRHEALASNLANVDTPGYRRQDVKFEGALQQALHKDHNGTKASLEEALAMTGTTAENANTYRYIPIEGQGGNTSLESVKPEWTSDQAGFEYRNDGNNVDVEVEMVRVAQNTQRFVSMAMLEGKQLKGLKSIINNNPSG